METEGQLRMRDIFVGIRGPRQAKKVEHDLVELLVIAVCGVLAGADGFVEIEEWAKEKHDWFKRHLRLDMDIAFGDNQMRARTGNAAHNFAVMRHFALNLIRLEPIKRKAGLKVRRLIAATSDAYRAQLLGLI